MRTENEQLNEAMDENARIDCSDGDCHGVITTLRSELARLQEQSKADREARKAHDELRDEELRLTQAAAKKAEAELAQANRWGQEQVCAEVNKREAAESRIAVLEQEIKLRDIVVNLAKSMCASHGEDMYCRFCASLIVLSPCVPDKPKEKPRQECPCTTNAPGDCPIHEGL